MAEEYGKIRKQILTDIADAIRLHKKSAEGYAPENFAKLIRSMVVMPAASGYSTYSVTYEGTASGILPVVAKGVANSAYSVNYESSATGALTEG